MQVKLREGSLFADSSTYYPYLLNLSNPLLTAGYPRGVRAAGRGAAAVEVPAVPPRGGAPPQQAHLSVHPRQEEPGAAQQGVQEERAGESHLQGVPQLSD